MFWFKKKKCDVIVESSAEEPNYRSLRFGEVVVVHNYEIGKFLEPWNGMIGIFVGQKELNGKDLCWVKFSEHTVAIGFHRKYLLPLENDYTTAEQVLSSLDWVTSVLEDQSLVEWVKII